MFGSLFDSVEMKEVGFYQEATVGFGASLYVSVSDKKVYFDGWEYAKLMEAPLVFTLVTVEKTRRSFGGTGGGAPMSLYKMVLMDASHCIFKAQANTGMSHRFHGNIPRVGASVTVSRYHWVWKGVPTNENEDETLDGRLGTGVMIIDDCTWRDGPFKDDTEPTPDDVSRTSVDYAIEFLDESVIKYCLEKSALMYLSEHWSADSCMYLGTMLWDEIKRGMFIPDKEARTEWVSAMKKRAREEEESEVVSVICNCQRKFCLETCVKKSFPLDNLDTEQLYTSVKARLNGKVDASEWSDLHPRKKRWCYYWWYAVNIYQCSNAQELPKCFVDYVRKAYPNPEGEAYVGHKSAEKRETERHERALAAMVGNGETNNIKE